MNYKELFNRLIQIIGSPSKAWEEICQEDTPEQVQTAYVYPLIALCGIAMFVGLLFGNGVDEFDFQLTLTKCCGLFISLFGGFYLATYAIEWYGNHTLYDHSENTRANIQKLVGYSMSVIFVLSIFGSLFPSFFILRWILQFYLIYIVWEGSKMMMKIPEDKLLSYTLITSVIILVAPIVIDYIFTWLSKMAN
ncbi:MAG: DUF1282 family protein [Bacteroidaceae bacterium]|nr:DUF1282 family protein [Bacteroidaceae bacterium]